MDFGLPHTPDRAKANMRAYMWGEMKDWLLTGAVETDEKMAMDLAGPGYHINRSNLLVLESKPKCRSAVRGLARRWRRAGGDLRAGEAPAEVEAHDETKR